MTSIQSYAQTGKQNPDTVRCYGFTELQYIAASLVECRTCDTLLALSNLKLANRDSMITEKSNQITLIQQQSELKDKRIELKDQEIARLNDLLEKAERHKKWLKIGWIATTAFLGGVIVYLAGH